MEYPSHSSYQASAKNCLGEIPSHWREQRVKFSLIHIGSGKTPRGGANVYVNDGISLFRSQNVHDAGMRLQDVVRITDEADELQANSRVNANDVLLNITGASIGRTSIVSSNALPANVNQHVCILRTENTKILPSYLHRLLCSNIAKGQILENENGTSREGLNFVQVANLFFPLPDIVEQTQIAKFLDHKTKQIDSLIDKKKTLIEKLNEQRIALITQAVTKGLNPDAPMKDSGVDWLGEIPAQWEQKPVKYLAKILRGKFSHRPRNDPAFYNGDYPFIQTGDIARAGKYVSSYSQTLNEQGFSVSKEFPAGTLVMTIAANIGDMAIIDFDACFPDSIVGFVPENDVDLDFLYYLFVAMNQKLMSTAVLNTQLNLNIDRIGTISALHPCLDEQSEIVEHLKNELLRLDGIQEKIEHAVKKLNEYRTALITAAVTGKIDVRNIGFP